MGAGAGAEDFFCSRILGLMESMVREDSASTESDLDCERRETTSLAGLVRGREEKVVCDDFFSSEA